MKPKVVLLCPGYIKKHEDVILEARSSSTLVLCQDHVIVVDTSSLSNRELILDSLRQSDIKPEEVDILVNTHFHHDHMENNDLFLKAVKMMHKDEGPIAGFRSVQDGEVCSNVSLMHTPGHTPGSMSVVVRAEKRYVVAGDAVPTQENCLKWVPPRLNYDKALAMASMSKIVRNADIIVPGHGRPFEVGDSLIASAGL